MMNTYAMIALMAILTYLIRMIPFVLFQRKIKSRFLSRLLRILPFAVLSSMTFPAVFFAGGNAVNAAVATGLCIILALFDVPMVAVAASGALCAYVISLICERI